MVKRSVTRVQFITKLKLLITFLGYLRIIEACLLLIFATALLLMAFKIYCTHRLVKKNLAQNQDFEIDIKNKNQPQIKSKVELMSTNLVETLWEVHDSEDRSVLENENEFFT